MADTKALFTQRFDAARTAWAQGDEPAAAESLHSAIIAARSDPSLRRELASALFNLGKLSRKFGPAGEAEAGPLLTEALAISEGLFGSKDAKLAPVLHELSRLHLQQSQHTRAEAALERLLEMARVKGEEHPDVAVALSDLAFVKRKLGDDASAEALYRDALRIREKVLEPNHMVTVGTLERLSETCAARGNFAEALALLRRALPTREAALGAGHERVRAARSRVAELELQVANAANTAAARPTRDVPAGLKRVPDSPVDTPSTHASLPIDSKALEFLGESEPRVLRPVSRPRERAKTPTVTAAIAAASLMGSSIPTPSPSQIVISAPESARPSGSVTGRESRAAHRDVVFADVVHRDVASGDAARADAGVGDWRSPVALVQTDSPAPARKKRTVLYASAGAAAVNIAIAVMLMLRPRAGSGRDPVSTAMSAAQRTTAAGAPVVTAPVMRTVSTGTGAAAMVAATHTDSFRAASATPAPTAAVIQREQRAPESALPELRAPRVEVHLDSANIPSMPAAPSMDAILASAMERRRASDTDRTETRAAVSLPSSADVDNAHTSPKIIGRAPDPGFPNALLRSGPREGQVLVRFIVNELGRVDVSSMIVERSDHELFTAAVREVLPLFRFEPARTLGPESKPVAVWVSVPFRFTTKKR
jgi:TonB family protein